ncbi:AbrB/MazE/SpoVT family DNA-binding domain-containing protein [Cellvibrio fontiphilus]|jgi:antitoxin component of MazEF toxin-antitoxin module|uniref:AbrB/MazE/SpoVT family DNA-binding domain-containing protein n=1 Tax=Cellvibrio fontiphilus TaxID=1815559 RepID=A0ABV7FG25_9GAMM
MLTQIRKIGNSAGAIIPSSLLKELKLREGDSVDLSVVDNYIVIKPTNTKPKYTLDELLNKCNPNAPKNKELDAWEKIKPTGNEI